MANLRKRGTKWQVQIRRIGYPDITRTFQYRDDALKWSRDTERKIDNGASIASPPTAAQPKLSDLLHRYETEISPRKRSRLTEGFYFRTINRQNIAKIKLSDLTATAICGYRDARLKVVSTSTVRNEITLLLHAVKIARYEWGWPVREEVLKGVTKPPPGKPRTRRLEAGELDALLSAIKACQNPLMEQVFRFALATAMRRGEVLSLEWRHVDLSHRTAFLPLTKNGHPRTVPLSTSALEVLATRGATPPNQELIFPISANAFRLAWEGVKQRAGIENLRFHDLRHEAISRFFEIGLSVPEVALISGHKDPRMLFRYTHLKAADVAAKLAQM